jgi:spermidine synthase
MPVDFVSLAQNSVTAEAFEGGALELLGRTVGFDVGIFMVKGSEAAATMMGLDAATRARTIARGAVYARELAPVKRAALAARGVAVDTDVFGVARVRETKYFRELARTVNGQHTLMAYIPWHGKTAAAVMLGRGGRGFSPREVSLVEEALPSLGVARAAFGLAPVLEPLPVSPALNLLQRVALGSRYRVLASVEVPSGQVVVRDRAGFREMVATADTSELVWTRVALNDTATSGWPYIELLHLAPALAKRRGRALFIGSGGAVALRQFANLYPGIAIDLVEREAAVVDLARTWFGLDAIPGVHVHIADGVSFIRAAAPSSWDVVVIDAYDASTFAEEFAGTAFLGALRNALRPGGAVACNVIGTLTGHGPVRQFVGAARTTFDRVRVVPVVDLDEQYSGSSLRNVVVVATRSG